EAFDARQPYRVVRHPTTLMLPVPSVARRAARLIRAHGCDTVVFGAALPIGLLAPALRQAGARRVVMLTHGHEAAWAGLGVGRALLRRIARDADVVTYLGGYCLDRLAGPIPGEKLVRLTPGVDTRVFRPGAGGAEIRAALGL